MDTPNERKMKMYESLLIDFSWSKYILERTTDPEPARRNDPNFIETMSHKYQTQRDEKSGNLIVFPCKMHSFIRLAG